MLAVMLLNKKISGPSYRYVRLDGLTGAGGSYVSITEIQILSGSGTNWCRQSGVIATAKSSYSGQTPIQAIDGYIDSNPSHRWSSDGSSGQWFQVDLGQVRNFSTITIATHTSSNQYPTAFIIKGSNDGSNWDVLKTVTGKTYPAEYTPIGVYP